MGTLSPAQANTVNLFLTTLLYGIYVVIFAGCMHLISTKGRYSGVNKRLLVTTVALFVTTTGIAFITFVEVYMASDLLGVSLEATRKADNISNLLNIWYNFLLPLNNSIADGLLIWRCYVLWGRRLSIVIVPMFLLLVGTACGYTMMGLSIELYFLRKHAPLVEAHSPAKFIAVGKLFTPLNSVYFATSFVTNVMMTSMIAWRVWATIKGVQKQFGKKHRVRYQHVVVESGAVYSTCLALGLILTSPVPVNAGNIISGVVAMSGGIFPTLIIVLIALGENVEQTTLATSTAFNSRIAHPIEFGRPEVHGDVQTQTHNIELQITNAAEGGLLRGERAGFPTKSHASNESTLAGSEKDQ